LHEIVLLKALADENRYRIISLLLSHNFCVGALAKRLQISEAAVSQHLQVLRRAGLVKGEKKGYWTHYQVQREALNKLAGQLGELAAQPKAACTRSISSKNMHCLKGGEEEDG
jgi:ArsR family transcriptional regulator